MILAALMLVLGAWSVQQMAHLPSLSCIGALAIVLVLLWSIRFSQRLTTFLQTQFWGSELRQGLIAFLAGLIWASSFAQWRMSDELPAAWQQKTIEIVGVVASVPEVTERGSRFRFDVEEVLTPDAIVPSQISLNQYQEFFSDSKRLDASTTSPLTKAQPSFHSGERWQLTVRLKRPHGTMNPHGFDFEAWALAEDIRATGSIKNKGKQVRLAERVYEPKYVIERMREYIKARIVETLKAQPYSGVIQALVMGDDSQISQADWQVFLRTGTTHLMSISGLHITMLSGLMFGLVNFCWRRVPALVMRLPTRKAATLAGLTVALVYALIAGFSIPTQRTLYMLGVFAAALWSGRQIAISQVLALALIVVVIFDPWSVISAGFWLSFGAVAILAYALSARVGRQHWLYVATKTQWAATVGMLPLLLLMFNQVSVISPVANALAIPLISFVVTPLALLGSFLHIDVLVIATHDVLAGGMWALKKLDQLPHAIWQQPAPPAWTLLPAILGVLWLLLPRGWPMRWFGLLGFLPIFFVSVDKPVLGDMKVTVLDVGQGLSVVVQTATHSLLYDAGPKFNEQSDAGSRIVLPFLRGEGIKRLDTFVVSHDDNDHSGGMQAVLANVPVTKLITTFEIPVDSGLPAAEGCMAGQSWVWDGVRFEIFYPSAESYSDATLKDNDRSCVIKITSHSGSLLLTGDVEKGAEAALLAVNEAASINEVPKNNNLLKSDVLIVPHHGSKTSSTPDFIAAVQPEVSVFTVGHLNRFGHPKPSIIDQYRAADSRIYRSDLHGAIVLNFYAQSGSIQIMNARTQQKRYWHDEYNLRETAE